LFKKEHHFCFSGAVSTKKKTQTTDDATTGQKQGGKQEPRTDRAFKGKMATAASTKAPIKTGLRPN